MTANRNPSIFNDYPPKQKKIILQNYIGGPFLKSTSSTFIFPVSPTPTMAAH